MSRPSAAATAPLDDVFLLEEILLRLPPQPSSLPRASLVCTRWRHLLSDPRFLRRFREHHHGRNGPPPLLGFFDKECITDPPVFKPTMGQTDRVPLARFRPPWSRGEDWGFFGCRHGLALLICYTRGEAVVWDPLTGHQRRIAFPPGFSKEQRRFVQNAAVMCAAAEDHGHVHGDCRFTPFRLALVCGSSGTRKFACLYQSESGLWGDIVSVESTHTLYTGSPSVLVRDAFCWVLSEGAILQFDFQSQSLAVTEEPADAHDAESCWSFLAIRTDHGGLGLAILSKKEFVSQSIQSIQLWERKFNSNGVAGWELQKTIQLDALFSQGPPTTGQMNVALMHGYDEETNVIFLSTFSGDYMLQLESAQFINLFKTQRNYIYVRFYYPYRNFYITGSKVGGRDGGAEM